MEREGYEKKEDQLRPLPIRMVAPPHLGALPFSSDNSVTETKPEISPNQQSNLPLPLPSNTMAPGGTVPSLPANHMLPSGSNSNPSGLATPQGYSMQARSQSVDQAFLQQQQQQQQQIQQQQIQAHNPQQSQMPLPQIQRSGPMLSPNTLSHMIGGSGNQMGANTKLQQLQMLQHHHQQQQQQQQQQQIPRKMMMGPLGPTGLGMANNMAGLGAAGLGNIMGMGNMGNIRGMSPTMAGAMSALGNINPNQISLTNLAAAGLRPSPMTQAQQNSLVKMRMAQQQRVAGMYSAQGGLSGMAVGNSGGSNPMLSNSVGLSMMGHNINRANMSQMQRTPTGMSPMGPPKMPGAGFYMSNQQQQQMQQQQQQMQQQQQQQQVQQQMQQQMQQIGSPLQQGPVGSPQGGSQQSGMIMPQQQLQQQQVSPQQFTALSPQQMSVSAVPQVSNGNNNNSHNGVGANLGGAMLPASPQLSSQTNVSVGSITSSPMEQFQGANKSGGPGSI